MYRIARTAFILSLIPTTNPPLAALHPHIRTTMSTSQSLTSWFQSRVSAVYDASDESSRSAALDALLAPEASVLHNDEKKDVADKRHRVMAQAAASSKINLEWGQVEESAPVRDATEGRLEYALTVYVG